MRDSNLKGIRFLFLLKLVSALKLSIIHPKVFLMRDSLYPLIPDVLICKSLFYRKICNNLDKNIPVWYQESPLKVCSDIYVRVIRVTFCMLERYSEHL